MLLFLFLMVAGNIRLAPKVVDGYVERQAVAPIGCCFLVCCVSQREALKKKNL